MYGVISAEIIKGSGVNYSPRPIPWVARITGTDDRFGLKREFVRGVRDYSRARKSGSRGVYIYFALAPGLYEVFYPISWKHEKRYFARVDDNGDIHEISREELLECLKSATSE